ncbi:hypothetical protein [Sulfitobacter aestuariivivens]|uniref:PAS domain-containing protein n=1 Tax=Sulfitobacter aestuariivivens TaxID=2766981 RepID=A0A927D3G3_9RHOB|nr:hypothetical protein [Sulfitobacter aestuariivivens]MBD3663696.1 hypothetical protein [Sulfitobacter aestuariivivens]
MNSATRKITHVSDNVDAALGWQIDALLGQPIDILIQQQSIDSALVDAPERPGEILARPTSLVVKRSDGKTSKLFSQIYRDDGQFFVELFLHDLEAQNSVIEARRDVISELRTLESVDEFVAAATRMLRR